MQDQQVAEKPSPMTLFETASKIFALVVVLTYACGFLITSIHDFQFGFSEMNPFRPRILTAGAWFFLFLAVPFTLVRQLTKTDVYKQSDVKGIRRLINLSWAYFASCNLILIACRPLFQFDADPAPPEPHWVPWKVALWVFGIIGLLVVIVKYAQKWPKWLGSIFTAAMIFGFAWNSFNDFYNLGRFRSSAPLLWLLAVGALFAFELTIRSGKLTLGDWPQSLIGLLVLVLIFSTRYYPHLLSSWGGGMSIPVTITYTKDAVRNPSQDVGYLLIDETDSGFYVVGTNDKTATFIPRTSVGLVRFAPLPPTVNH